MTRRSATFQEVALSVCPTSHHIQDPYYNSVPEDIGRLAKEAPQTPENSTISHSRSFLKCIMSFPKMTIRFHGTGSNRSVNSDSLSTDSPPPEEKQRTPGGPLAYLKRAILSATKMHKSPSAERRRSSLPSSVGNLPTPVKTVVSIQSLVDKWADALQEALELDLHGDSTEALLAYSRFNRQVTRESIVDFEHFTCDQQKLLSRLMLGLDRRIKYLRFALYKPTSERPITCSDSEGKPCLQHDTTLRDLYKCLDLLDTIKTIGSTRKVPVVLVYRERRHRTQHRERDKGKSNKILFAREKRDFLQIMGLPRKMITEQGIDFSVRPSTPIDPALNPALLRGSNRSSVENSDNMEMVTEFNGPDKNNGNVNETQLRTGEGGEKVDTSLIKSRKEGSKMSLVGHCLGMTKKPSVSPLPDESQDDDTGNQYQSTETLSDDDDGSDDDTDVESNQARISDTKSTLSCDSCSSNESFESDFDEENETDTAVLANYTHSDTLLPPPFHEIGGTYAVLLPKRIGLKKARPLHCPFLRMSLRDEKGELISREQETFQWKVVNRNYLKTSTPIFIQESIENLPEDTAIFLELRHLMREKRKVSTLCYTFLEKSDIRAGEFVCELYKPPVQFNKQNLVPYTVKAFFLHMEMKVEQQ